jgi:hypothetical protein
MYNQFINAFIDAQTAAWRAYRDVESLERALFGEPADKAGYAVRVPAVPDIERELRRVYEALVSRIIFKAREDFKIGAARPVIDRAVVCAAAGLDIERSLQCCEVPDFERLWSLLEARFAQKEVSL